MVHGKDYKFRKKTNCSLLLFYNANFGYYIIIVYSIKTLKISNFIG